ncbi:MAG: L,D-transpeptidase family protein [Verrucomicrobiales bacterium]|nr:L,D-transpeptidase family protein [Verrucomicrobiales bacterium]
MSTEPDKPAADEPEKAAASEIDKPAAVEPDKPAAVEPDKPAAVEPDKPAAVEPDKPAAVAPDKPAAVAPDKPAAIEPDKPAAVTPDKPAAVAPDKPAAVAPDKPAAIEPDKPVAIEPGKPAAITPDKPAAVTPDKPAAVTPDKPAAIAPDKPAVVTPEKPADVAPEKLADVAPDKPAADAPDEPVGDDLDIEVAVKQGRSFLRSVWFWVIAGPINMLIAAAVIAWAFPFLFLGFPDVPAGLADADKAIVIDKYKQAAYGYEKGKLKTRYVILTGDGDHDTPTGKFKITKKDKDYVSREYGSPMPNSLFFIESRGIAMHSSFAVGFKWCAKHFSGHHPYIGSHGCVRMTPWGSIRCYKFADLGTPVWVVDTRN